MGKSLQNWNHLWALALASIQIAVAEAALAQNQPEPNGINDTSELSHSLTPPLPRSYSPKPKTLLWKSSAFNWK